MLKNKKVLTKITNNYCGSPKHLININARFFIRMKILQEKLCRLRITDIQENFKNRYLSYSTVSRLTFAISIQYLSFCTSFDLLYD